MQLPAEFLHTSSILLFLLLLPPSQTLPSPPPTALTIPLDISTNLTTTSSPASNGRCASRASFPSWYAPNWLVEDCYAALQQLYIQETMLHPNQEYEFLQPGASRKDLDIPWQKTPRKYVVNTCTLTIMLLSWFGPGTLPSPISPSSPVWRASSDTSTYQKIWAKGRLLENTCPEGAGSGGWCAIGDKNAMGIFIWATDSDINFKVKGGTIVELSSANVSVMDAVDIGQTS
ncbi:hypothetical protein JMJ35_007186 [Cladonia borealis]|uniref:Uncharacterized protein n=1 Tax=Cladonia borealis TaxID=184061 RepID=A0AA39QZC3_9LECA|nr:hypothetical protein JMJ35_007186 [Cladonia borealis]